MSRSAHPRAARVAGPRSWAAAAAIRPMSVTYEQAIRLVLSGGRSLARPLLLAYFDEHEHGEAGEALDAMVLSGDVAYDGTFYRLAPPRRSP